MLFQSDIDFGQIKHQMQIAVLVGEFYEYLSREIFNAKRIHEAIKEYQLMLEFPYLGNRSGRGSLIRPDLYIPVENKYIEVKATQIRSAAKVRLSQFDFFEENCRNLFYVFWRYNFRGLIYEANTTDKLIDILCRETKYMVVVSSEIISRVVRITKDSCTIYASIYKPKRKPGDGENFTWKGGDVVQIKPCFFNHLFDNTEDGRNTLCDHLGFNPEKISTKYSKEEHIFFRKKIAFDRVDIS